ncbi:DUF6639 family protein [Salipiger sp. CCB-MM3]|uniref:DUF6639 family protein n=1 Tax=Salipiger sp. CCB-MM3 TaxID=1792508 RepID=UPI0012F8FC7C|nr:DUF6639 family protein [Salipiger sp. CCB-MM3]
MRRLAKHRWIVALALGVSALLPITLWAEPMPCPDAGFRVEAETAATRALLCEAAVAAREQLGICGLRQSRPIDLVTAPTLEHEIGRCLASYDCTLERIRIIEPDLLRANLLPDDPYAGLPDDVIFRSLLTHELAHALVEQHTSGRKIALVDHEYIANALELMALPPEHRATLLNAAGLTPPVSAGVIDILIYGLAPRRFAAAAYLYLEEHGCETVRAILDGSASFDRGEP